MGDFLDLQQKVHFPTSVGQCRLCHELCMTWFDCSWISFLRYCNITKKLVFKILVVLLLTTKIQPNCTPHVYYRWHTTWSWRCVTRPWTSWVSISSCLKIGAKSANGLGEVWLYSTKWVKLRYSTASHNPTQTQHNNQHEPPPPCTPAALPSLSPWIDQQHHQIMVSPLLYTIRRPRAVGLVLTVVGLLAWEGKMRGIIK